ncbi:hypothetical protein BGX31_008470 [Mortierella sp. GBA43]|nr:hypothetical protein BGX31_008470 [Mortierella sp. GBA43]
MATSLRNTRQTPTPEKQALSSSGNNNVKHTPAQKHRKGILGVMDRHQIDAPLVFMLAVMGTYAVFPNSVAKKFLFFQEYDAYCLQLTPTWNNWFVWFHTDKFYDGYPVTALPVITKYYYWIQFSFWVQQMFVLCIEAPRKDFAAMISHHLVTVSLIIFSLALNVTTFGNAVFVSMDLADIVLSLGKCFKYIEMPDSVCDPIFACFMFIWIYTRHFLYGHIIYAWIMYSGDHFGAFADHAVTFLMLALMSLMFFWLWSILRIVYKMFATKGGVVDDRSDDEQEQEKTTQKQKNKAKSSA